MHPLKKAFFIYSSLTLGGIVGLASGNPYMKENTGAYEQQMISVPEFAQREKTKSEIEDLIEYAPTNREALLDFIYNNSDFLEKYEQLRNKKDSLDNHAEVIKAENIISQKKKKIWYGLTAVALGVISILVGISGLVYNTVCKTENPEKVRSKIKLIS